MNESTAVGIVGLGTMGLPIAARLVEGGVEVHGFDVRAERLDRLVEAGGNAVERPSGFPRECTIFLLLLPNPEITDAAVFGEGGLAESLKADDVVVNLGTIGPDAVIGLGEALRGRGVRVLDAPMGKSSREAAEGTLSLMVAGEKETFEELRPIFEFIAGDITFCGDLGVASTVKIVNNLVSGAILAAVSEGLMLGAKAGAPLDLMVEVLSGTGADSYHLRNTFGKRVANREFEPGFSIDLETKDMGIGLDMASRRRMPMPVISQAHQRFVEGQAAGLGSEDWGALVKLAERDAGEELA
jgi:3-hydroxyisobutyrate dehydrogenase-like beta-hydroxyacid dehydrogenase